MNRIFAIASVSLASAGAILLVSSRTTSAALPTPSSQAALERNFDAAITAALNRQ